MHEPAGVVEILVQNPQNTPYSEVQNTPPQMKIVRESKSKSFRKPPEMKIVRESESESFRIPPPNENCHRVWIREFQNTPPQKKSEKLQISNFRIVLQPGRSYAETNL